MKQGLLHWSRGLLQLVGLAASVPAVGKTIPPSVAPASWVRYAGGTTSAITRWLESDQEQAVRLRQRVATRQGEVGAPLPPLVLQLWIGADGVIRRVEFEPSTDDQVNADLRSLVVGRDIGSTPPRDMRQPMYVAVQLQEQDVPETVTP